MKEHQILRITVDFEKSVVDIPSKTGYIFHLLKIGSIVVNNCPTATSTTPNERASNSKDNGGLGKLSCGILRKFGQWFHFNELLALWTGFKLL